MHPRDTIECRNGRSTLQCMSLDDIRDIAIGCGLYTKVVMHILWLVPHVADVQLPEIT